MRFSVQFPLSAVSSQKKNTQLNCRTTHAVPRGIPHLRDWSSTLLRAHVDLCQWSSDVCSRLDGIVPCAVASREVVVDELYQKFLAILSWHAHVSDVLPDAVSLHGGPQSAMPLVLPGMVHGVITGVSTLSRPSLDSGLLGPHSIGQCARPSGPSGRTG